MFGIRPDGKVNKKIDPIVRMTSMLMPQRCDSMVMLKKEIASETGFCSDDYTNKLLQEAFDIFGKTTAEEQISRLKHICGGIITRSEELLQPSLQKAKLSRSFGIIAGLLAAAILL